MLPNKKLLDAGMSRRTFEKTFRQSYTWNSMNEVQLSSYLYFTYEQYKVLRIHIYEVQYTGY